MRNANERMLSDARGAVTCTDDYWGALAQGA